MIHFCSSEFTPRCQWCGENLRDGEHEVMETDKAAWRENPQSCYVAKPLTTAIFEESGEWATQYFEEDAIKIADDVLAERIARITPLLFRDDKVHRIVLPNLRSTAFTWEPDVLDEAKVTVLMETPTFHGCGYYGFFKPSIAEVLAQLPDDPDINGFFIKGVKICGDGSGHIGHTHWVRIEEN